jgi:microcystin degradation protein MlrC
MRIAIGEIAHETNSFRAGLTGVGQFQAVEWQHGAEILEKHQGVRDYLGGMLAAGDELGIDIVPTFAAAAEPSATIAQDAYATMRDELLAAIDAAGAVDAICLSLHGAGSAEGVDDVEGTLLAEVREAVGPDLPLVVTLDLHGHMTPAMVEHADLLLHCHEYPHVDCYERGVEAIHLAARLVRGEIRPHLHLETLPMMIPPTTTMAGPGGRSPTLASPVNRARASSTARSCMAFPTPMSPSFQPRCWLLRTAIQTWLGPWPRRWHVRSGRCGKSFATYFPAPRRRCS